MIECEHCHKNTYADARFCHMCGGAIRAKSKQVDLLAVAFVVLTIICILALLKGCGIL